MWVNHDHDLLDVTLHTAGHDAHTLAGTSDAKQRVVALRAHGLRAPPDDDEATDQADLAHSATTTAPAAAAGVAVAQDETIHTTANHPWLTTDRGWVAAGGLHTGEQVDELGGRTATVTALAVRPGAATYYNLTVSNLHTYAVGASRAVVHNTGNCGSYDEVAGDLAAARQRMGISPVDGPDGTDNVVARLDIGAHTYYSRNAHGLEITTDGINIYTKTHAEAGVFQRAVNDGVRASSATLYVDTPLCGHCMRIDGVPALAGKMGVTDLTIYTPLWPDGIHLPLSGW